MGALVSLLPARATVAVVLGLMALSLDTRQILRAFARPTPVALALVISFGILPFAGWALGNWLLQEDLRIGLQVATSVPCTMAAAIIWTRMGGGNEAVALLITLLTSGLSWMTTTAWLTCTTAAEVKLDAGELMLTLVLTLIVPVGLGQLLRAPASLRGLADRWKPALSVLAQLLVLVIILQAVVLASRSVGSSLQAQLGQLALVSALCLAIHLLGLGAGYYGGFVLGLPADERIAAAIAGSQKTLPVSLVLITSYFSAFPLAVVPILVYHIGQLVLDSLVIECWARQRGAG